MNAWETDEYWTESRRRYEEIRAKYPALVTVGFECLSGWYRILERYFEDVRAAIPAGLEDLWSARQIKEKLGGARIYADFGYSSNADRIPREQLESIRDRVSRAYYLAECRADRTCEVCGKPGRHLVRGTVAGWHLTRCLEHADGGVPVSDWHPAKRRRIGNATVVYDATLDNLVELPRLTVSAMLDAEARRL